MTDAPYHFGAALANQTLEWLAPDTQENYARLCQRAEHLEYFQRQGWDQPGAITYQINSHGFRCDEFDPGIDLVVLGCSYTMGYGLPIHVTWPYKLAAKLAVRYANLAWGGYSADTCFRLARYWIPKLQPGLVVMLTPPANRFELLLNPESALADQQPVEIFMPNTESHMFRPWDQYIKHYFLNEENFVLNKNKNELALRGLCGDLNIKCLVLDSNDYMTLSREQIGYARDYLHGGPPAHDWIVRDLVDMLS